MEIRMVNSITFHWIKGHTGLEGNERADYLARTIASYNPIISYDAIPVSRGKQLLEDYYTKIWNGTYVNSEKAKHTKTLIPSIFHRLDLPLWSNYFLTQLLTNHGCFRSYLYKMGKVHTSLCNCPKKSEQTARHLILDCSLLSKERPTTSKPHPPPDNEIPHKHSGYLQVLQSYLPHAARSTKIRPDP
jgi:hypothetical protein